MRAKALYNKYSSGKHWEQHPTAYAKNFSTFLSKNRFSELLVDVGCGNGRDAAFFTRVGFDTLGIDRVSTEIESDKKSFCDVKFEVGDIEKLKFVSNSVGAFFMINVVHYVNQKKAIKEIFRTLIPGGYFYVHFNLEIRDQTGKIDYQQGEKEIKQLVKKFVVVREKVFYRTDTTPITHEHKILELILQKKT